MKMSMLNIQHAEVPYSRVVIDHIDDRVFNETFSVTSTVILANIQK